MSSLKNAYRRRTIWKRMYESGQETGIQSVRITGAEAGITKYISSPPAAKATITITPTLTGSTNSKTVDVDEPGTTSAQLDITQVYNAGWNSANNQYQPLSNPTLLYGEPELYQQLTEEAINGFITAGFLVKKVNDYYIVAYKYNAFIVNSNYSYYTKSPATTTSPISSGDSGGGEVIIPRRTI